MSETNTPKIRVKALREFTDAGTETRRAAGAAFEVDQGTYDNYVAGGLVEKVSDEAAPAENGETTKTRTRG